MKHKTEINDSAAKNQPKPIAVIISDVHFNLATLEVASFCLEKAIQKANELNVTLIVAGDLHDTKANLRGECVKRMLDLFHLCKDAVILRGNHDAINERSEEHSLEFLRSIHQVIDAPLYFPYLKIYFIPYFHDTAALRQHLKIIPPGSHIIMHQGLAGALPGGYAFDKTALNHEDVAPFKVLSGHYHEGQTINDFTYIGNPYTLDFSEAKHPAKGFIVLYEDFTISRIPCYARKHTVINITIDELAILRNRPSSSQEELYLVKVEGPLRELKQLKKEYIKEMLNLPESFKLDLIPTDKETSLPKVKNRTTVQLFNDLVEADERLTLSEKDQTKQLYDRFSK